MSTHDLHITLDLDDRCRSEAPTRSVTAVISSKLVES